LFIFLLIALSASAKSCETIGSSDETLSQTSRQDYLEVIESINMTRVSEDIRFFSSLGTRASGYPGNWLAAQHIYNQFESFELENLTLQEFKVVDCIDHGTNMTFLTTSETVELYSVRPNFIAPSTTPPEGILGRLVYVKDGDLEDLEGNRILGNIVMLDWKAGSRWLEVYKLGAKAIIFLDPDVLNEFIPVPTHDVFNTRQLLTTTFIEDLPLKFPRFYAPDRTKSLLLGHLGEEVLLKSSTYWDEVKTWNVMGMIRGTEWPDQSIMIVAHYDSYSDAPRYAPGAQEASSVSSLLELARYLHDHRPKHTVILVAVGGHHQNLEGFVQFVDDYLYPRPSDLGLVIKNNILWLIDIQVDTGSDELLWLPCVSGGRGHRPTVFWRGHEGKGYLDMWWLQNFVESSYREINRVKPDGKTYHASVFSLSRATQPSIDVGTHFSWYTKVFDMEPIFLFREGFSSFPSASAFTTAPYSKFLYHPFDEYQYVNLGNLQTQLELLFFTIHRFLGADWQRSIESSEAQLQIKAWLDNKASNVQNWLSTLSRGESISDWGVNASGTVAAWNNSIGWYCPVPGALVVIEGGAGRQANVGNPDPRWFVSNSPLWFRRVTIADGKGHYVFKGGMGNRDESMVAYMVSSWVINPSTGDITYTPDMGMHRYGNPNYIAYKSGIPELGFLAVFQSSQIVVEIYHPRSLTLPTLPTGDTAPPQAVLQNERFEQLDSYGTWNREGLYVLAVPPNEHIKVLVYSALERYPFMMLLNSTPQNPEGYGFTLAKGQQLYLPIYQSVSDLNIWATISFEKLIKIFSGAREVSEYSGLTEAGLMVKQAEAAFRNGQYMRYLILCKESWDRSLRAYVYFRAKGEGSAATVPFFSLLSVPFTILAEALLLSLPGKKKVLSLVLLFGLLVGSLYLLHPGFSIAASPVINVIGFSMLILQLPIFGLVVLRVSRFLRSIKVKYVGEHEIDISRMKGSFMPSFKLGVENMKRRKLRSSLVLVSVILLVLSVSLFTSISPLEVMGVSLVGQRPPYQGVLLRKDAWGQGGFDMGERTVDFLKAQYTGRATIAPRVWLYMFPDFRNTADVYGTYGYQVRSATTGKNVSVNTLWGLSPQEKMIFPDLESLIVEGRWFEESEESTPVCILTEEIADEGQFRIGERVAIAGTNFTTVGIISNNVSFVSDLDREFGISPIKFDLLEQQNPWNIHVDPSYYVIVPARILLKLGGRVASIAVKPNNVSEASSMAEEVFSRVSVHLVYYSTGDEIRMLSARLVYAVFGSQFQLVPSVLVLFSLLNMLLGSLYERRREMGIFSSVGLSPTHIAVQFVAEAVTYSTVGTIVGYLLSLLAMNLFGPRLGISLDYSSMTVLLVVAVSMVTVMASSLYPALTAARLVTPSLERTWSPSTKPKGERWEIPLPFTVSSDEEANQLIGFLREFLKSHEVPDAEVFSARSHRDEQIKDEERIMTSLHIDMNLAPYDMGVSQSVSLSLTRKLDQKVWNAIIVARKTSGLAEDWERLALRFIDTVRKQFLLWKSMPEEKKLTFG